MSLSRRRFITISAGLALSAVAAPANAKPVVWRGVALGANAELLINDLPEDEAQKLITLAIAEIERLEGIFSIYRTDSAVMNLNRMGRLVAPPPELLALLSQVEVVHEATGGLFDPTIQSLWAAYAEHRGSPPPTVLQEARARTGWKQVAYDPNAVNFGKPGMALSLNGIAQGFITDRITDLLRANGLKNAVVNIGEISVLGRNSDNQAWRIFLDDGRKNNSPEFLEISDQAIATSSPDGTTFDGDVSHIINPLTSKAASSHWERVSVIHDRAAIADGLSTAMVMMEADEMQCAAAMIDNVGVYAKPANGEVLQL